MGSDGADGTEIGLRFTLSDCFLLKLHCGDALSGVNYQFANGAPRRRDMLSGAEATISNRRALPNFNDSDI